MTREEYLASIELQEEPKKKSLGSEVRLIDLKTAFKRKAKELFKANQKGEVRE